MARQSLDDPRHAFPRCRQHLARENASGAQHFVLSEISERKLADEIICAGLLSHLSHLHADRAWRSYDGTTVLHDGVEILGDPGIARLGAVLVPELHEACMEYRPGPAAELHRFAIGIGRDDKAVDPEQGQLIR